MAVRYVADVDAWIKKNQAMCSTLTHDLRLPLEAEFLCHSLSKYHNNKAP